ncbi:LysM peptidoglycan-binding domain-containing protein [Flectobacillus major]|uniref:LysM peptidoglycan-binding domain-containing protein n=1 Tax=Flectobacillus major TaxID=103 RepID=UPI0004795748|nr:LysM domain-containing protein [Flectobacillus major]
MTHTVQAKETLFSISKKYGLTVEQLMKVNNLLSNNLFIGQNLVISLPSPVTPNVPAKPVVSSYLDTRKAFVVNKQPKGTFNNYTISFPSPNGTIITGLFRDNYPSPNRVNAKGISYTGKSLFDTNRTLFADLCQQNYYLEVLHHIAKNEGCFDAINSYDKAIFSFGFIQFTGAKASGAMLTRVLQRFKLRDEYAFNDCFTQYGINIQSDKVPIFKVATPAITLEDDAAYTEVANNLQLTGAFIASGFRRSMIRAQVEIALEEYVLKAVSPTVMLNFKGQSVPLNNVLKTEGGFALRIDLCVNRGLTGSLSVLKTAIEKVAQESGITTAVGLAKINERRVVEVLAMNETDTLKRDRTLKLLNEGFSFWK